MPTKSPNIFNLFTALALAFAAPLASAAAEASTAVSPPASEPAYTADNRLLPPANYREWIFLSSGLGMSYSERVPGMTMFDNVFVDPAAYHRFLSTGHWPDKTMLVMEVRGAETKGSISQHGSFQTREQMGLEVHVRDTARFDSQATGGWAFFSFDDDAPAKMIPTSANCYACHQQHAAVDTTFVQFYPTLLDIAGKYGTLSGDFATAKTAPEPAHKTP